MEKVGFIGAYDKVNIITNVAKLLKYMGYKVIVVDATQSQKIRYIAPSVSPTKSYITELEGIDFAVGFEHLDDIYGYLGINEDKMNYDYMLIDSDSKDSMQNYRLEELEVNFFVTGFDLYSLKKGLSILENILVPIKLTKVLCRFEISEEDEDYLNYLSDNFRIKWNDFAIYLPYLDRDTQAIEENQRMYKIRIKKLTPGFQDGIIYIAQKITGEKNLSKIKKSIKE